MITFYVWVQAIKEKRNGPSTFLIAVNKMQPVLGTGVETETLEQAKQADASCPQTG